MRRVPRPRTPVPAARAVVPLAWLKLCAAIPAKAVTPLVGATVASGRAGGALQSQCRWAAPSGGSSASITVRTASTWAPLPGGRPADGVPGRSSVAKVGATWQAVALVGPRVVVAELAGPKASRTTATALLRLAVTATG